MIAKLDQRGGPALGQLGRKELQRHRGLFRVRLQEQAERLAPRRILAPDGILVATFDNRLAAVDYYLQGGDIDALRRFLSDGVTHWLTKDAAERFPIHTFSPEDVRKLCAGSGLELLDMVGSTVLPIRQYRHLLEDAATGRQLARMERSLHRIPSAIGRASHLLAIFKPLK